MQTIPVSHFSGDLTLLYSETKEKALSNVGKCDATPALSDLHRKLRIQKDRLITWGIEWSDQDKGPGGDIDESIARAGFTETVTSVLGNIKEVLEQAEKIKTSSTAPSSPWSATPEKQSWYVVNEAQYQDHLKDLTTSIDILYDLSRARRALATGSHPTFSKDNKPGVDDKSSLKQSPFQSPSFASSELTLVNPSFTRPNLSPYAGLPASIDPQALKLPAEHPPPYESSGIPTSTRMVAHLIRSKAPESVRGALKSTSAEAAVLIEFENYDPLYRDTGVPPPLQRLEKLATALQQTQNKHQQSLTLLGYFEDPQQPRIGLVYDFLSHVHGEVAAMGIEAEKVNSVSLLGQLQGATKLEKPSDAIAAIPFLEDRFSVALRVTEALKDLHSENFFHGNLNSGSVIFLQQGQNRQLYRGELHRPLLSSFDLFSRSRVEYSAGKGNANITKHPDDKLGSHFDDNTALRYDLYGLGLLLLEIGLWSPLHDLYKSRYTLQDFKLRIEKLWIPRLAAKCGSLYMRAVQTCLRLSDDRDISKIDIERIYSNIIGRLQRCCLLDEDESVQFEYAKLSTLGNTGHSRNSSGRSGRNASPTGEGSRNSFSYEQPALSTPTSPLLYKTPAIARKSVTSQISRTTSQLSTGTLRRAESFKQSFTTAADSVSNTWHSRRETLPYPFKEYRRKVMLIQSCWRQRCMDKKANTNPHEGSGVAEAQTPHHHRTIVKKECLFPVNLPQYILDDWQSNLGCRLSRIVERALKGCPESSTIDLVGLGHDSLSARATIIVTCTSTSKVKAALKRKFDYDRSKFDLKVRRGEVKLSRGNSMRTRTGPDVAKRSSGHDDDGSESDYPTPQNPYFQPRPLCGASIGAYLPSHGHLEPVSYGGVVMVEQNGETNLYGMSVHHMLEPQSDDSEDDEDDDKEPSSNSDNSEKESSSGECTEGSDTDSDEDHTRRSSRRFVRRSSHKKPLSNKRPSRTGSQISESLQLTSGPDEGYKSDLSELGDTDEDDESYMSSDFESEPEDTSFESPRKRAAEPGDRPGVRLGAKNRIQITQPAFDDAMSEELHPDSTAGEKLDEDHLSTYSFGKVFASSGLKRWHKGGMTHEIDWALIELDPPRLQPYNLVRGGRQYCTFPRSSSPTSSSSQDMTPTTVLPTTALANLAVHCISRTSGLSRGTISPAISFVKIFGRTNYSSSWSVIGDFGVGGDSGAWVVDNASGGVCGHVLAERGGVTYICPMEVLFAHIEGVIGGARVTLPEGVGFGAGDARAEVVGDRDVAVAKQPTKKSVIGAMEVLNLDEGRAAKLSRCRAVSVKEGGRGMREGGQTVRA